MHLNKINPLQTPDMSMRNRTIKKKWDVREVTVIMSTKIICKL